jgi:cytochrome c553
MMKNWIAALTLVSGFVTGPALAATGDAAVGAQKAAICGACHGANGNSPNPEWPNLASQHTEYTVAQLKAFQQGVRNNPIMMPNAAALSAQDMADLGAYFSRQTLTGLEADPALYKTGQKLYRAGDSARGIPACMACHGPEGKGNGPARYPVVRSQHSVYAYNQLKAYATGARTTPGNNIMPAITQKLTDDEMKALATYMQGLR